MLGEWSSVRPEAADMSERHQERTVMGIVHKTGANTDINTDRPDNSDPGNISDVNLFKCGVQDTQEGQPMEGMTKSRQEDLSGFELAVAGTDKEPLPTSYTLISRIRRICNSATTPDSPAGNWKTLSDARYFKTDWWDRSI